MNAPPVAPPADGAAAAAGRPLIRLRRRLAVSAAALGGALLLTWGLDVAGSGLPEAFERIVCVAALLALLAWLAVALVARLRGVGGRRERAAAAVLPLLFVAALAVRLLGVDHEVLGRYYLDEGTYYKHATAIDEGQLLVPTFVYPHFLYYADAVVLWIAARFPALVAAVALRLFGVREPLAVAWILLRALVALLSALTTLPVYAIGRRLGGRVAAALGAVVLILSPLYNDGSHLNICDVPSAFFATVCLAVVARLLERETTADYLLAGLAAGVAAGTKYPAGVVAVAIAAAWLRHRIASRNFSWGLVLAALAAVAGLLAVTPSLAVFPHLALFGQRGLFFGVNQYGRGGWLGVMPDSNALYYAQQLLASFGWPLVLLGLAGLFALPKEKRRLALWLLPYPAVFLALLVAMNMVVKRNLYPVVPIAAALLGTGVAVWMARLPRLIARVARWPEPATAPLVVVLLFLCLGPSGDSVARQEIGYVSRTTREEALDWIRRHVPQGAGLVKESYTPDFSAGEYDVLQIRFAGRLTPEELHAPQHDYLLLSSAAYARFLDPDALVKPHQKEIAERYKAILDGLTPIREWTPGEMQLGPLLQLYRLDPDPKTCKAGGRLAAADAFVPDGRMRSTDEGPIEYELPGQWSLFKGCFAAGAYRVTLAAQATGAAEVRVVDQAGSPVATLTVPAGAGQPLFLPHAEKVLFYVALPVGGRLQAIEVRP